MARTPKTRAASPAPRTRPPSWMERVCTVLAHWTGTTPALVAAFLLVLGWVLCGPLFHYSDTWQLVINTTTTIITFLMVFMIQRAQNKDAKATALKLNELIAAIDGASNRLIDLEHHSEAEIENLRQHFRRLVALARKDRVRTRSHTVEEAEARPRGKSAAGRG